MKLSIWAKKQGVSYLTAYRWFRANKLPVKAYQTESGTIIVEEPEMILNRNDSQYIKTIDSVTLPNKIQIGKNLFFDFEKLDIERKQNQLFKHIDNDLEYIIVGEVPGFSKDDITIIIDQRRKGVSIKGERKTELNYFTSAASFEYDFPLPINADIEKISASQINGILEIKIPKLEEKKIQIEIK